MTYEMYQALCYGGAGLAAAMAVLAVVLFFRWDIPSVVESLSGSARRKWIESRRSRNETGRTGASHAGPGTGRFGAAAPAGRPSGRRMTGVPFRTGKLQTGAFRTETENRPTENHPEPQKTMETMETVSIVDIDAEPSFEVVRMIRFIHTDEEIPEEIRPQRRSIEAGGTHEKIQSRNPVACRTAGSRAADPSMGRHAGAAGD